MSDPLNHTRRLVWLYFWLLLLEGALRKWLVPGLSSALLIIRDPVVIAIYFSALQRGVFPRSRFVAVTAVLGLLCVAASFAGEGNWIVTIYGWRANFLHLPLIVLLPEILRREDLKRLGFVLLLLLPFMTLLAVMQFRGGPDSRWNVGAGGETGGQLFAAEGKVRASGTFSFSTGFSSYLALCTAFLLHDLLAGRLFPRWLVLAAVPSLVLALVVSASRTAVVSVAIVCSMVIYIAASRPAQFGSALRPILATLAAIAALTLFTPLFNEGLSVHRKRFESGGGVKKGIVYRYAEGFVTAGQRMSSAPLLGYGLGIGTNVGANLLRGSRQFLLGEGELERVIMESGPILGLGYLALRTGTLLMLLGAAFAAYRRGETLPLLLVAVSGVDVVTGQFGQPTILGLAVFTSGLALTAARAGTTSAFPAAPDSPVPAGKNTPGRSAYAERLHGPSSPPKQP